AGKESEPLARFDCRPRQDDALDRTAQHHVDGGGDREIGLARAGGTEAEHQLLLAERTDIGGLICAPRRDAALARAALLALVPERAMPRPILRQAERGIDGGAVHFEPALEALVKRRQGGARHLGADRGTRDGQAIAARDDGDAELPLDAVEVFVA